MDTINPSYFDAQGSINNSQSPPLLPKEYQNNHNKAKNNYRNKKRKQVRPKYVVSPIKKVTRCRIIWQIIFSQILYGIIITSLTFQFLNGFRYSLIDNALIFILGTAMLLLSLKGESSCNNIIGGYNIIIFFCGSLRIIPPIKLEDFVIFFIRNIVVLILTVFNCFIKCS